MIAVYTQDYTILREDANSAKTDLITVYGEKLGEEAYKIINNAPIGTSYRKYGGPLVMVVDQTKAEEIKRRPEECVEVIEEILFEKMIESVD